MKITKGFAGRNVGRTYTVARFPDGTWTYGGKPDSPDYAECEVWRIKANYPQAAIRSAQGRRYRERKAQEAASPTPAQAPRARE